MDILAAIKADQTLKSLADQGVDNAVADRINSTAMQPQPLTFRDLLASAPSTLKAVGSGGPAALEPIAARIRESDWAGVGAWADALFAIGTMSPDEHTAVESLVAAANVVVVQVTDDQVSEVLNKIRHVDADGAVRAHPIDWSKV